MVCVRRGEDASRNVDDEDEGEARRELRRLKETRHAKKKSLWLLLSFSLIGKVETKIHS